MCVFQRGCGRIFRKCAFQRACECGRGPERHGVRVSPSCKALGGLCNSCYLAGNCGQRENELRPRKCARLAFETGVRPRGFRIEVPPASCRLPAQPRPVIPRPDVACRAEESLREIPHPPRPARDDGPKKNSLGLGFGAGVDNRAVSRARARRAVPLRPVARVFRPGAFPRQPPGEPANSRHEKISTSPSLTCTANCRTLP